MTGKKSKIAIYLLGLLFLTQACQQVKKTEKPKDLISEEKMADIITELSLLNAARNFNKKRLESTGLKTDSYIYDKFKVDSLQFERSSNYYAQEYVQYVRIYDSVDKRLDRLKVKWDSLKKEQAKNDSIKLIEKDSLKILDTLDPDTTKTKTIDSLPAPLNYEEDN